MLVGTVDSELEIKWIEEAKSEHLIKAGFNYYQELMRSIHHRPAQP